MKDLELCVLPHARRLKLEMHRDGLGTDRFMYCGKSPVSMKAFETHTSKGRTFAMFSQFSLSSRFVAVQFVQLQRDTKGDRM